MTFTTKLKLTLSLAAIGGLLFTALPALASTNLFFPFSGYRFVGTFPTPTTAYRYGGGKIFNVSQGTITVEASLGHANGGVNGFDIYGAVTGPTPLGTQVSCRVDVTTQSTGAIATHGTSTFLGSPQGNPVLRYNLLLITAPPSGGAYFYTMRCTLPPGTSIVGVRPTA